jgi:type II secretion system (T2SS) protein M
MRLADRIMGRSLLARRGLALLLLPSGALVIWGFLFLPLKWIATSQMSWREATRVELARARGHAELLQRLRQELQRVPSEPVWQRLYRFEPGADGALAVQRDVAGLSAAAGLVIQTIVSVPSQDEGALMKHGVRLSATGTSDQLETFATQLHEHAPYLRAERLRVTSPQMQQREQNPVLNITMDIAGYSGTEPVGAGSATHVAVAGGKSL